MTKQTAIIIPARYGSSRLEGKPLLKANDKPIIQWVWEKASKCPLVDRVIVATDDERIFYACKDFGAEVEMTSTEHKSGSDRIAEVASRHPEIGYIINLQGDEPLIEQVFLLTTKISFNPLLTLTSLSVTLNGPIVALFETVISFRVSFPSLFHETLPFAK